MSGTPHPGPLPIASRTQQRGEGDKIARLTVRQREVLAGIASGKPRKQIAEQLGVSENTLRVHCQAIFMRLDVHTAVEASVMAMKAGLV